VVVSRGEVWWYDHPTQQRRPYLVLTRSEAVPVLNEILAVPVTSTVRGIPTEVELDRSDGVPGPCVASLDNTTQIRPALCTEWITTLGPERMDQVCEALRAAVAC
jgi:mRNA interferase MazF